MSSNASRSRTSSFIKKRAYAYFTGFGKTLCWNGTKSSAFFTTRKTFCLCFILTSIGLYFRPIILSYLDLNQFNFGNSFILAAYGTIAYSLLEYVFIDLGLEEALLYIYIWHGSYHTVKMGMDPDFNEWGSRLRLKFIKAGTKSTHWYILY